jgi:hypothetical protein
MRQITDFITYVMMVGGIMQLTRPHQLKSRATVFGYILDPRGEISIVTMIEDDATHFSQLIHNMAGS